tara:strand:- start:697 stop:1206 length:510 start_codon:yes stop_codon:yes gene_type:complete
MDQNLENNKSFKNKAILFFNENKLKIIFLIFSLITVIIFFLFLSINSEKKNNLIAEQYIQAGIHLSSGQRNKSIKIYENIILSKNRFYSILALNTILEKKLVSDEKKILDYFDVIEGLDISTDRKDLILLKKSLYLMKNSQQEKAKKILKELVKKKSQFKNLANEILSE